MQEPCIFRFANFVFNTETGDLAQNGSRVRINKQTADVLAALIRRNGELVTRQELRCLLWPDGDITNTEKAINNSISRLRYIFNDDSSQSRFIERVPKRGYRFLIASFPVQTSMDGVRPGSSLEVNMSAVQLKPAPAEEIRPLAKGETLGQPFPNRQSFVQRFGMSLVWLAVGAILIAVSGSLIFRRIYKPTTRPPQASTKTVLLGVAPFDASTPEAAELAVSFRMDLEDSLSELPSVKVTSGHSLEHTFLQDANLPTEAAKLNLEYVLFGRVMQHGKMIALQLELVRARDATHIASIQESGTTSELASMRDRIQGQIFAQLHPQLLSEMPSAHKILDSDAYAAYLQGKYFYSLQSAKDLQLARESFEDAVRLDPQFAKAYASLGRVFFLQALHGQIDASAGYLSASRATVRALQLDPNIAEAHAVNALLLFFDKWEFDQALVEGRRAVELDPSQSVLHQGLSLMLAIRGRTPEALVEIDEAQNLDRFWVPLQITNIYVSRLSREYPRMLSAAYKLMDITLHSSLAENELANALWIDRRYLEAISVWRQMALEEHDMSRVALEDEGLEAFRAGGPAAYARVRLSGISDKAMRDRHPNDFEPAEWQTFAGDYPAALLALSALAKRRDPSFVTMISDPMFDPMRGNPIFRKLLRDNGF